MFLKKKKRTVPLTMRVCPAPPPSSEPPLLGPENLYEDDSSCNHWRKADLFRNVSCTALFLSSDTRMLKIQQYKRKTRGFRIFPCFGPHIWNLLPQDRKHYSTPSSFKAKMKTFLFSQHFRPNKYQYPVSATVIVCVCVCVFPYVLCKLFW